LFETQEREKEKDEEIAFARGEDERIRKKLFDSQTKSESDQGITTSSEPLPDKLTEDLEEKDAELAFAREEEQRLRQKLFEIQEREKEKDEEIAFARAEDERIRKKLFDSQTKTQNPSSGGGEGVDGEAAALRAQLQTNERALQDSVEATKELEHKLKEVQTLRESETAKLRAEIEEMMVAAEDMQTDFEARERELLEASKRHDGSSVSPSPAPPSASASDGAPVAASGGSSQDGAEMEF